MNAVDLKDIFQKWTKRNQKNKNKILFAVYIENLLKINYFGNITFYILFLYIFLYETQKVFQLFKTLLLQNKSFSGFPSNILNYLDYFSLETYLQIFYDNNITSINKIFVILQLLLTSFFPIDYFLNSEEDQTPSKFRKILFNLINFFIITFSFSFNYINLNNFFNIFSFGDIWFWLNLFNMIFYTAMYMVHAFFFNDVSPEDNLYYPSISNTTFNVLTYIKFFLYNVGIILCKDWSAKDVMFVILGYFLFYIYIFLKKTFFINRSYFNIILVKISFFSLIVISHFFISFFQTDMMTQYNTMGMFLLLLSSLGCFYMANFLLNIRMKYIYKYESYSNARNMKTQDDEMFIYYFFSRHTLSFDDLYKHRNICDTVINEEQKCFCNMKNQRLLVDHNLVYELKAVTCDKLSKIHTKEPLFELFFLTCLVKKNRLNFSLFGLLLKFDASKISFFRYHFLIRILLKFIQGFQSFYMSDKTQKQINKLSFESLNKLILYEFTFRCFLKDVKNSVITCSNFWIIIKNKPINSKKFFELGIKMAELTVVISQGFGTMQKLHPNQIKLLKVYACFINTILNDLEYSQMLVGLMKEKIQMMNNVNINMGMNMLENDYGILIISGEIDKLFRILTFNKHAKNCLKMGANFGIKDLNIHYLQPFPFNLFHNVYLKTKFDITLLSKERNLYCLDGNGDLVFINVYLLPYLNLEGKINFFLAFYMNNALNNSITALVDLNGFIYAANKEFKDEYGIKINFSLMNNIDIFEKSNGFIMKNNDEKHMCIDYILNRFVEEGMISFPSIFKIIEHSKNFIKPLNSIKYRKETDNLDQLFQKKFPNPISKMSNIVSKKTINEESDKQQISSGDEEISSDSIDNSSPSANQMESPVPLIDKQSSVKIQKVKNNKSFKYSKSLKKGDIDYKLHITRKSVLSGLFSYYFVSLTKQTIVKQYIPLYINRKEVDANYMSVSVSNYSSNSMESEKGGINEKRNKMKTMSFLNKFQNDNMNSTGYSKIFKTIYFYLIIILASFICINLYNLIFSLSDFNKSISNFSILKIFFSIRFYMFFLVHNTQTIISIKNNLNSNNYSIFNDKLKNLNQSIISDMETIESFYKTFITTDLGFLPNIANNISSPIFQLTSLIDNSVPTINYYDFQTSLSMYFSQIKKFVNLNSFSYNIYGKKVFSDSEKTIYFILYNYMNSFRNIFSKMGLSLAEDCNMEGFKNSLQTFIILEIIVYILIIIFVSIIAYKFFKIHLFIIQKYNDINIFSVNTYIDKLLIVKGNIFNIQNEDDVLINNSIFKSSMKNNTKSIQDHKTYDSRNKDVNDETNQSMKRDKLNTTSLGLLNKEKGFGLMRGRSLQEMNKEINKRKLFCLYLFYFIKGYFFLISFIYVTITQLNVSYDIANTIEDTSYDYNLLITKAEVEFLMIDYVQYSFFYNSTLSVNNEDFYDILSTRFLEYQREYTIINFNNTGADFHSEIHKKVLFYHSDEFCNFFYTNISTTINFVNSKNPILDCESTILKNGLQIYLYKIKNDLYNIYTSFLKGVNKNVTSLMDNDSFNFGSIVITYYLRRMYEDLNYEINNFLSIQTTNAGNILISIFSVFLVHIVIFIYILFFWKFKDFYYYFEKLRVIISIIAKDNLTDKSDMKDFIEKYY